MRIKNLFITICAFLSSVLTFAYDFESNGIYYQISDWVNLKVGVTYIEGIHYSGDISIPSSVDYNGDTYLVSSIGWMAFSNCTELTSIDIPNTVSSIGSMAFSNCTKLTSIDIPNTVTSIPDCCFLDCSNLTSITIPGSISYIQDKAFNGCISLKNVVFMDGENNISLGCNQYGDVHIIELEPPIFSEPGKGLFADCPLESLYLGRNILYDYFFPHNQYSTGLSAFYNQKKLSSVEIGEKVTNIPDYLFSGCSSLTQITIPSSVTSIKKNVFEGCTSLKDVSFLYNDNPIFLAYNQYDKWHYEYYDDYGKGLFADCPLETLYLGRNISYLYEDKDFENELHYLYGFSAFYRQTSLKEVSFSESVTYISAYTFAECSGLSYISLPNNLISIGSGAFSACMGLENICIPSQVIEIGGDAFFFCTNLKEVNLGNSVLLIGDNAFSGCESLKFVKIPDSVISIGDFAFKECKSLKNADIGKKVSDIGIGVFSSCNDLVEISVDVQNESFSSLDGVLYYKNQDILKAYPGGKNEYFEVPENVISIANYAFHNCANLAAITFSNTLTWIGDYAFAGCSSLKHVTIPNLVTSIGQDAFYNCESLTSVILGNSITSIGNSAFSGCENLKDVYCYAENPPKAPSSTFGSYKSKMTLHIPKGSLELYKNATEWKNFGTIIDDIFPEGAIDFEGITDLTFTLDSLNNFATVSGASTTANVIEIPAKIWKDDVVYTVTGIETGAFANCAKLEGVAIPETVTEIGDYAFYMCSALRNVELPESVESIGDYAFAGCWNLKSAVLGSGLSSLGANAFENCKSLATVSVPGSVDVIRKNTFAGCSALKSVAIGDGVMLIGENAFAGCSSLESIVIPGSVLDIDEYAFADCYALLYVSFNEGLRAVGMYAFKNCRSLESVNLPFGTDYIGECAFWNCTVLTDLVIPETATSIGAAAFYGCTALSTIHSYAELPPACDVYRATFDHYDTVTLHVPIGSKTLYAGSTEWKKFANVVEDLTTTGVIEIGCDTSDDAVTVYNLQGIELKVSSRAELQSLPSGLYIVNGKKEFVK